MDRCALFVDAGYVLTDGAMAVHGTRRRESVSWDYAGLLQLLGNMAMERTRLPLLRAYWYEATADGLRSAEHDTLADLPGVKLRVTKARPGRREGVEGEIRRDLGTLARNKAVSDVMVVSAEEDLAQVIADVQDQGMRVTLLHIAAEGNREVPRALRQECDDFVEVGAAHLRPYVELVNGAEPARPDEPEELAPTPVNGTGRNGAGLNGISYHSNGSNGAGQAPSRLAAQAPDPASSAPRPVPPAAAEAPDAGQQERQDAAVATDYATVADLTASVDYSASVDYGTAAEYAPPVEHQAAAPEPPAGPDYGQLPDYAAPAPHRDAAGPREALYAAPVPVPVADEGTAERDRLPAAARLGADPAAYAPGMVRDQYHRDGGFREPPGVEQDNRLQPVPVAVPNGGSAQVRHLPSRGPVPVGPGPVQPPAPQPGQPALTSVHPVMSPGPQQPGPQQLGGLMPPGGGHHAVGQPTGSQPAVPPAAPVPPMDAGGMGYGGPRGGAPSGPRPAVAGPVGLAGPNGPGAPGGNPGPGGNPAPGPQLGAGPAGPGSQPTAGPQGPGGPVGGQPDLGGPSGPIGLVGPGGYPQQGGQGISLGDAVQSAHEEGQAFGESVARDAPALWLEAVLARKPRMPSDLEARLLQGSALPIDFLLHDEVRHALRRGFWDALERARR